MYYAINHNSTAKQMMLDEYADRG